MKSEDKDSNTGGTTSAHVEDTTTSEESTAPSGAPIIIPRVAFRKSKDFRYYPYDVGARILHT